MIYLNVENLRVMNSKVRVIFPSSMPRMKLYPLFLRYFSSLINQTNSLFQPLISYFFSFLLAFLRFSSLISDQATLEVHKYDHSHIYHMIADFFCYSSYLTQL